MTNQFLQDVLDGLSRQPRRLPSKYFYDEIGDKLFQRIMAMDEYYLTRAEYEVLNRNVGSILHKIGKEQEFSLVEFGAGDGMKTRILLGYFIDNGVNFHYLPIDISRHALDELTARLARDMPSLVVKGIAEDYFTALTNMESRGHPRVVLFLGSNIGNFTDDQAQIFLGELYASMSPGDMALIGFDLKKDPDVILDAYNDSGGITADFNLNLLERINRELNGNFIIENFRHYAMYDPVSGQCRSYLISQCDQRIRISGNEFELRKWEPIHTEISRKFDPAETDRMAANAGFQVVERFFDEGHRFMDALWVK